MRLMHVLATLLLTSSSLCAQMRFASPPGADFEEGNSSSGVMWGSVAGHQSRVQQADNNFVGHPFFTIVRKIAWRRDELVTSAAVARRAEIQILMAHTDYSAFTNVFANNYKDAPVTVFTRKYIDLPDWTQRPVPPPAPFDLSVPFDVPWIYNRADALLWEVAVTDTTVAGRYGDDWFSRPATRNYGQTHADQRPGCTTPNGTFTKRDVYTASAAGLQAQFGITGGPSNAAVLLLLGVRRTNIPVPGLCAPVGVDFLLTLPAGSTNTAGALTHSVPAPWDPAFSWAPVATQAVAPDASQPGLPVALSNATLSTMPRHNGAPEINVRRTFVMGSATAATGSNPSISAVPTEFTF